MGLDLLYILASYVPTSSAYVGNILVRSSVRL